MAFYFSTKQIPQLAHLSLEERVTKITQATNKLTVPEKTLLNVFKLLVIVPAFALALRITMDWTSLLWAVGIIMLYPFFVRPVQYTLAAKYLPSEDDE